MFGIRVVKNLLAVLGLVVTCILAGCGGGPKIVAVEGVVTLNGKPLDKIMVEFWPVSEGPRSFGETNKEGRFKLTTDDGKRVGAVVGKHKVIIKDSSVLGDRFRGREAETTDITEGRKSRIGNKYGSPETTPISQTVEASGKNDFTIEVVAK